VPRHAARRQLLHLRRASGCFGSSRGLSRDTSRAGSSSTTSPTPCVRVPRHVAGLVTRLVINYSARAGSSSTTSSTTRVRLLRHVARLVAWLVVDYFTSAARPGASSHCAARCRLL
jgi:hypothetical protein